jgi:hypothetical protein
MEMVTSVLNLFDGEQARIFGTILLLIIIGIDYLLSHDDKPGNTFREWLLSTAQRRWGAFIPFMLGALLGHFYHPPGAEVLLKLEGHTGLYTVLATGLLVSILGRFLNVRLSKFVLLIASVGVLMGAIVWPV